MLEKNFVKFKEEYEKDSNFSGLSSLKDFKFKKFQDDEDDDKDDCGTDISNRQGRDDYFSSILKPPLLRMEAFSSKQEHHNEFSMQLAQVKAHAAIKARALIVKTGWIRKRGHIIKTWNQRWFV